MGASGALADPVVLRGHDDVVHTAAFSPDGRTLLTSSADATDRLWDVTDPGRPAPLAVLSHPGAPGSAQFAAGGRALVTAADHRIRVWDTDVEAAARRVCALAGAPITPAEWARYFGRDPYRPPCG